mgnify:FL=1
MPPEIRRGDYAERMDRIAVLEGDITRLSVDAIVNAANESLMPGGGVCGAIHRAAGPGLWEECHALGTCDTGQAKITKGYCLPAKHVIHTVGPVWEGGGFDEDAMLASCYRESLAIAAAHGLKSVAFPAISTGIYGFPADRAARIAVREVKAFLAVHADMSVTLVCFGAASQNSLQQALQLSTEY